ncbi:uncharacterized protein TNCV_1168111 [Trichonephila clavipes]|uniref:DUF382 domain-containing protein n=1 Tax=Trichonephila clavipes TaxID=2585209 RepID=A0A8X6T6U9_TRICX|nr:uncharacterized protein TNCV_1168111 [Trichonephila clavipes]
MSMKAEQKCLQEKRCKRMNEHNQLLSEKRVDLDGDEIEEKKPKLPKRKLKKLSRMTVAELQQKVNLKVSTNIILVPQHWCFKHKYSQDKRVAWKLPDFIKQIGIMKEIIQDMCNVSQEEMPEANAYVGDVNSIPWKKPVFFSEGNGVKLKYIRAIASNIQVTSDTFIELLHRLLYLNVDEKLNMRRSILEFSGLKCDPGTTNYVYRMRILSVLPMDQVKLICRVLCLPTWHRSRQLLTEGIMDFLAAPRISVMKKRVPPHFTDEITFTFDSAKTPKAPLPEDLIHLGQDKGLAYCNILPLVLSVVISVSAPQRHSVFLGLCKVLPSLSAALERVLCDVSDSITTLCCLHGSRVRLLLSRIGLRLLRSHADSFPSQMMHFLHPCLEFLNILLRRQGVSGGRLNRRSAGRRRSRPKSIWDGE